MVSTDYKPLRGCAVVITISYAISSGIIKITIVDRTIRTIGEVCPIRYGIIKITIRDKNIATSTCVNNLEISRIVIFICK